MEMKASDLSARLLATENLSVIRARTRTASFDIKSRVLTLPMWKDMTPDIEDMLIGHEVGHALYTEEKYMEPIKENPKMMGYLNILEDVRIEKLIKRKYPGLRKRMNEGYKQLNDRDFFGIKQVPSLEDLLLIDKINLYFKAGFQCGVKFTPDEKEFVNRAERTESIDDVIELARDVYAFSKQQAEERKERMKNENPQDVEEDEDDPIYGDFDVDMDGDWDTEDDEDSDIDPYNQNAPSRQNDERKQEEEETDLESKTERAFRNKLEELADENTEYRYWKFDTEYEYEPVVSYKTILNETKSNDDWNEDSEKYDYYTRYMTDEEKSTYWSSKSKEFTQFKTESSRTVNYLVKEFEMKKSAKLYKRASVSKIGSLDMRKIYAYKLQDDLFKRVTSIPQGKNHGMIMLVDWSGSMNDVLQDTMKQVINLAMFCNRIQIPYRVLAFTTSYKEYTDRKKLDEMRASSKEAWDAFYESKKHLQILKETQEGLLRSNDCFNLLELFSNKMTTSEFNTMARRVLDPRFQWNEGYNTGGTPLNEGLVWVYNKLGDYIKNNSIEKMTFITLTDGEGAGIMPWKGRIEDSRTETVDAVWKRIKIKNLIREEVTQKTYEFSRYSNSQTHTILRMIKDRYNVSLIGFHICENRKNDLRQFLNASLPDYYGDYHSVIETWRKSFRANGFASIPNTGRDELFLIPQSSTVIQEGSLDVEVDANAKAIAKNFGKYLNVKKTSRILLNRFVTLVA
jgi:hypothetical protein